MNHHVRRESTQQRIRVDILAPGLDAKGAVGDSCSRHQAHPDVAQIGLACAARRALATRRYERRCDVVTYSKSIDTFANLDDDAGAFVAAEHGERCHRDVAAHHVMIGMTQSRGFELDLYLALARIADIDFLDRPWLIEVPDQSSLGYH